MPYDFLSFSEKGKGKGVNLLTCLSGFNIIFFSSFGVRIGGLLVSLLLLFYSFFFLFRYPLDMYLICQLSYLPYVLYFPVSKKS